jgi:hypothetical protein
VIGRPVDVAEGPDGAFYVSDDYAGAIYRVAYGAQSATTIARPQTSTIADPLAVLPPDERAARRDRGAALFERTGCPTCHVQGHAARGEMTRPLVHLSSRYTVDALVTFFDAPTPPMPRFDLPAEERRDLAVYVLSTYP